MISIWYGYPEPSLVPQHDAACFHKDHPGMTLESEPIPPKEPPKVAPCSLEVDYKHAQACLIDARHVL